MSFRRKVINRISSSLGSDESYLSEDLKDMIEELVVDEEEKLTKTDYSLDNIQ